MDEVGLCPPEPLPANRDAWNAFVRVCYYRHVPMGTPHLPNWSDIAPVLTLYDLWTSDVHGRLSVCFAELMTAESEKKATDG